MILYLQLNRKIEKSEKVLANLSCSWSSSEQASDQELLTEEERQTFRTIGLKMDEHLLLGMVHLVKKLTSTTFRISFF